MARISNEEKFDGNGKMLYEKVFWPNGQLRLHRNWEGQEFKMEEYEKDGSPSRQMMYQQKEREKEQKANDRRKIEAEAIAALESGDIIQAVELYESIGTNTYLITGFMDKYREYLDTKQDVWWLKTEYSNLLDKQEKLGIAFVNSQMKYCLKVLEEEQARMNELKELESRIKEALNDYNRVYGEPGYSRGKVLYEKSRIILDEMKAAYLNETDFKSKKAKGEELIKAYAIMNEIPQDHSKP